MGSEEGTSIGDGADEGGQCLKRVAMNNGFVFKVGNNGEGSTRSSEGLQTYKRRKHVRSSSESKCQDDGRGSAEAASKFDQTSTEPWEHLPRNCATVNGSSDVSHRQWRKFVLERIYQCLSDDEDGIRGCFQEALMMTVTESNKCDEDSCKSSSQTSYKPSTIHHAAKEHASVVSNEAVNQSCDHTVAKKCRHVLLNIILSEKFSLLCKLLYENFQEMNADNVFSLNLINKRMKEGTYEHTPILFSSDIQQLWTKLEVVGTELVTLAKSLSEVSRTCYNERFYSWESNARGKSEQAEAFDIYRGCTCKLCGNMANWKDCLVCDACEEVYHFSCIKPAVEVIPCQNWYCASCTARGIGSPHENCVVCEKLNPGKLACQGAEETTNEEPLNEFEDTSYYGMDDSFQVLGGSKLHGVCKMCGNLFESGEKVKICDHAACLNKCYHVRCLTSKQLKSYGPRWYCPSCLCRVCLTDRDDDDICLCDGCDHAYHIYCMNPPLTSIPRGKWFCRKCDVKIQEIRRVRKAYEKKERKKRRDRIKESKMWAEEEARLARLYQEGRERERVQREGMDILLDAALNCEATSQMNS